MYMCVFKKTMLNVLIMLLHFPGDTVISGTKYVLRTDVIYQRPLPAHPKLSKFASAADAPASVRAHLFLLLFRHKARIRKYFCNLFSLAFFKSVLFFKYCVLLFLVFFFFRHLISHSSYHFTFSQKAKSTEWEKLFEPSCKMYHD